MSKDVQKLITCVQIKGMYSYVSKTTSLYRAVKEVSTIGCSDSFEVAVPLLYHHMVGFWGTPCSLRGQRYPLSSGDFLQFVWFHEPTAMHCLQLHKVVIGNINGGLQVVRLSGQNLLWDRVQCFQPALAGMLWLWSSLDVRLLAYGFISEKVILVRVQSGKQKSL